MAKKKVSNAHQEKSLPKHEEFVKPHQQVTAAMGETEASEKLESLKTLNQMLLKEAVERRQQVDSLVQSKGSLESELNRSNSERDELKSELTRLGDRAAKLELERSVVAVFVALQVGQNREVGERKVKDLDRQVRDLKKSIDEKESEIGSLNGKLMEIEGFLKNEREVSRKVSLERDDLKDKLDLQIVEDKGLRANLVEMEQMKEKMGREIKKLLTERDGLVSEKEERDQKIESIMREKESIEKSLGESNKLVEVTKEELQKVVREKEGVEQEKDAESVKRSELENMVGRLNEMVASLQKEEEKLRVCVAELEKKCAEGEDQQKEMDMEIRQLIEENNTSAKNLEALTDEKLVVDKNLVEALKQIDGQRQNIEEMVNEKVVLLEAKGKLDTEVGELQSKVAGLAAARLEMEDSSRVKKEKIKSLESEVGKYMRMLKEVEFKRDGIKKCLEEEIVEMEKKIKETFMIVDEAKAENAAISVQKMELEKKCETLKKEIISLENVLNEARNELDVVKDQVKSADAVSEFVLNRLKNTSSFCSKEIDEVNGDDVLGGKQITGEGKREPYMTEFETIKNAFKTKATKVENLKKQVEFLQDSVEAAHKKKSFWTIFSSITTLLAAVSLAYAARAH